MTNALRDDFICGIRAKTLKSTSFQLRKLPQYGVDAATKDAKEFQGILHVIVHDVLPS